MARTVNRQPLQVSTSSGTYSKDEFFNQVNWKGMNVDKNFLVADGESFESCNNVYVNEQGILRSRPALKIDNSFDEGVVKCWRISGEVFYLVKNKNADTYAIKYKDAQTSYKFNLDIKPVLIENRLFVFSNDLVSCMNLPDMSEVGIEDVIYRPVRYVHSAASDEDSSESSNILTDSMRNIYLYEEGFSDSLLYGKRVKVKLYGEEYEFVFDELSKFLFYEKRLNLPEQGEYMYRVFSKDGYDSIAIFFTETANCYYSVNGTNWDLKVTFEGYNETREYLDFNFTLDGSELYLIVKYPNKPYPYYPYLLSVSKIADESGNLFYRYGNFTSIYDAFSIGNSVPSKSTYCISFTSYNKFIMYYCPYDDEYKGTIRLYDNGWKPDERFDGYGILATDVEKILELDNYPSSGETSIMLFIPGAYQSDIYYATYSYSGNLSSWDSLYFINVELEKFDFKRIDNKIRIIAQNIPFHTDSNNEYDYALAFIELDKFTSTKYVYRFNKPVPIAMSTDGKYVQYGNTIVNFNGNNSVIVNGTPLGFGTYYHFLSNDNQICITQLNSPVELNEVTTFNDSKLISFSNNLVSKNTVNTVLSDLYLSIDNNLYISEARYDEDGNFLLYVPDYNLQTFTSDITALHPISKSEVAVFLNNEIWVCTKDESVYRYNKTKIPLGVPYGTDILGSYEADATIFMTKRGLAFLKYQDYVASTEQNLSFVSDPIYAAIENKASRLKNATLYKYWVVLYGVNPSTNFTEAYVYDLRNGSWWPMESKLSLTKLLEINNKLYAFNGNFYEFSVSDSNYDDDTLIQSQRPIDWHLTSQKLHFGAINYSKHIANITLFSVLDSDKAMSFDLTIKCYRKLTNTTEIQTNEFFVDAIRTYVQRLSFPKVNEFQYTLSSDDEQAIRVPLSLSGLTIKYRIGSQVR